MTMKYIYAIALCALCSTGVAQTRVSLQPFKRFGVGATVSEGLWLREDSIFLIDSKDYSFNSAFGVRAVVDFNVDHDVYIGLSAGYTAGESFDFPRECSTCPQYRETGSVELFEIGAALSTLRELGSNAKFSFQPSLLPSIVLNGTIVNSVIRDNGQSVSTFETKLSVGFSLETSIAIAYKLGKRYNLGLSCGYGLVNVHNESRELTKFTLKGVDKLPIQPSRTKFAVAKRPYTLRAATSVPTPFDEPAEIPKVIVPLNYISAAITLSHVLD